jgi:hypothetical protein
MKSFGRWAFLELDDPYLMESQIDQKIAEVFQEKIASLAAGS